MRPEDPAGASQELAHRVARLLRHEMGDFLQGVFSLLAVLRSRLGPGQQLEERLMGDFRRWADRVRAVMDGTVRLLSPGAAPRAGGRAVGDLVPVVEGLLAAERRARPDLPVRFEAAGPALVACDMAELGDVLGLLLASLAQGARGLSVHIETGDTVVCKMERDGLPPTSDQLAWLESPFATTQQGPLALAFALCARTASSAGGGVDVCPAEQSVTVRIQLPSVPPP